MVKTENIHIIKLTQYLVDRLTAIKFKPESIFCEGVDENLIINLYPNIHFERDGKVDLILSVVKFSAELNISETTENWKKHIKSEGLILFAFVDVEYDIRALGDILVSQEFRDVVLDYEDNILFGHALGPKEIRITLDQIRRAD